MLMLIAASAILLTTVLLTLVYYDLLQEQEIRVTCIDEAGQVVYDCVLNLQNGEARGEYPEAMDDPEPGEGQESTLCDTVQLPDGNRLRVTGETDNLYQVFLRAFPGGLLVLAIVLFGCLVVAGLLTRKFIRPLQRLATNLDAYEEDEAYEELTPLVNMIKEQHQDIIKAARIRQDFTANVTHELKTPLTSISGYAELLETGMASEKEVQRFAQGIHKSANRLLSLINDIIKLSELDSAEQEFVAEAVDLYELAQTCVEMLQPNAEKHQVTLVFEKEEQHRTCLVKGNKQMLEELLFNLCDNAIRYNNPGGNVWVQVTTREEQILLKVKDNGIGIPAEHQDRIFERFYRVDKSRSKQTGGTGLGLAIVKHIIARHHASLELDSEVGIGTEIRVLF